MPLNSYARAASKNLHCLDEISGNTSTDSTIARTTSLLLFKPGK